METIKDLVFFINNLFFVGYMDEDEYKNFDFVRNSGLISRS